MAPFGKFVSTVLTFVGRPVLVVLGVLRTLAGEA
jgi:hypothetical protein